VRKTRDEHHFLSLDNRRHPWPTTRSLYKPTMRLRCMCNHALTPNNKRHGYIIATGIYAFPVSRSTKDEYSKQSP